MVMQIGFGIGAEKNFFVGLEPGALVMVVFLSAIFCVVIGGISIVVVVPAVIVE
jgi:hypothetical protein